MKNDTVNIDYYSAEYRKELNEKFRLKTKLDAREIADIVLVVLGTIGMIIALFGNLAG
jgi:hypothetical protein